MTTLANPVERTRESFEDLTVIVRDVGGGAADCSAHLTGALPDAAIRLVAVRPPAPRADDSSPKREHVAEARRAVALINEIVEASDRRFVLVLDSDVLIERASVLALMAHLEGAPGCAAVGANVAPGTDPGLWRPNTVSDAWRTIQAVAARECAREPACFLSYRLLLSTSPLDPASAPYFVVADLESRLGWRGYSWDVVAESVAQRVAESRSILDRQALPDVIAGTRRYVSSRWRMRSLVALWLRLSLHGALGVFSPRRDVSRAIWEGLGLSRASAATSGDGGSLLARIGRSLGRVRGVITGAPHHLVLRARRRRFVFKVQWKARLTRSTVKLRISKDLRVARDVQIEFHPGTHSSLTIEQGVAIQSGSTIRLGGDCFIGPRCQLRYGVILNAKGSLILEARNVLGRGTMVHADGDMVWEWGASCAEYVSVLDSHHEMDGTLPHVHDHPVVQSKTTIGASSLIGAHATVLPGVALGRGCLVGAGSVVTRSTPDRVILAGVPAKVISSFDQTPRSASE